MSRIQSFLPRPILRQVDHLALAAEPDRVWERVRRVDLYQTPLARLLFRIRLLPGRLRASLGGRPAPKVEAHGTIDDVTRPGDGFQILTESQCEIVVGAVGKFWQPAIDFVRVAPAGFAAFAEPGFGKVAWSLAVTPRPGGSWLTVDVRVDCTSDEARAKFFRYWPIIGRFSRLIRRQLLGLIRDDLGAGIADPRAVLPGDELIRDPRFQRTHTVDVEVPPSSLWPWLVQMGCQRAGWYSFDRLDNGGVPSADRIRPELQELRVGDVVPSRPSGDDGFMVLRLEPERLLVLGAPSLIGGTGSAEPFFQGTWSFVLEPIADDATHLTIRLRAAYEPTLPHQLATAVIGLVHELMERKQLSTLKSRAEAAGVSDRC